MKRTLRKLRNSGGTSLVELLIVVLVMSFIAAASVGLLVTAMGTTNKLYNRSDLVDQTRVSLDRICKDVREARVLGGASNPQTLIINVPKFSDAGFPYMAGGVEAMETHTFAVIPDPQFPGEWIMTWTKNPGPVVPASANPRKALLNTAIGPVTIVKGIIGPLVGGTPTVFQYVNRNDRATPQNTPTVGVLEDYTGVIIQMETIHHQYSAQVNGQYVKSATLAYKSEVFMRNNANVSN